METAPRAPVLDDLLAHASWVRALARSLVADTSAAEDVVQETWVSALESPPARDENLRGWLATVVHNAVRMRARGAGRRAAREALHASEREDALPSSAELAERMDTQRRLAERVLELDEPYRSTVVLRYFEGLTAAEIARRARVPAGTVRWRLKAALDELRGRLDEDFGGERATWVALVLPLARRDVALGASAAGGAGLLQGILAMNLVLKLTLAAALAALALTLTPLGSMALQLLKPSEPLDTTPVAVTFQPLEREERTALPEVDGDARTALDPASANVAEAAAPAGFRMRVIDPDGEPVAGAVVGVYGSKEDVTRTDALGEARLLFGGERPLQEWMDALSVSHPEFAARRVSCRPDMGTVVELGDLVLQPAGSIEGRVLTADGRPASGAWVEVSPRELRTQRAYGDERARRSAGTQKNPAADEHGRFRIDGVAIGDVRLWAGLDGELAALTNPIEVRRGMLSSGVEVVLGTPNPEDFITGEIRLPDGTPAARAEVDSEYASLRGSGSSSFTTTDDGRFKIAYVPASPRTIRVQDREERFAPLRVEDAHGGDHLVLQLLENEYLELTLTGDGDPIAAPQIWGYNADHTDVLVSNPSVVREDSRFRVPIPREPFQLEVTVEGYQRASLGPFDGLAAPRSLEVALHALPGLRGRVTAEGAPLAGASVELYQLAERRTLHNGFVVRVQPSSKAKTESAVDGAFDLTFREAGEFYVRVSHPDHAPAELGPYRLDPEEGRDGVDVELSAGGVIEGAVRIAAGSAAGRIVAVSRGDGNSRTTRCDAGGAFRFERLMPGRWLVELTDEERIPGHSSTTRDRSPFSEEEIAWNCEVFEGTTTRFDIGERPVVPAEFAGTLTIDGEGAEGWVATLIVQSKLERMRSDAPEIALDESGAFTLAVDEPGEYRLSISDPSAGMHLVTTLVTLSAGRNEWSASFDTGELLLRSLADPSPETMDVLVAERDGFVFLCWLRPEEDGTLRLRGVPAGACRVTRHRRDAMEERDVLEGGETLLRGEVEAGGVLEGTY